MYGRQIPHGPEGFVCPLHKEDMSKVCHTCPLWIQLRGKNPQSNQEIDVWDCSLARLPILMIENTQVQRETGAAIEDFRNVMAEAHECSMELLGVEGTTLTGEWPRKPRPKLVAIPQS